MSEPDDLRVRLSRLDPAPDSLDPVESPRAQELLERIMATPVLTSSPSSAPAPRRRGVIEDAVGLTIRRSRTAPQQ